MLRIIRVLAHNPGVYTLEGTNTWIVGEDPCAIIDPGPEDEGHLRSVQREAGSRVAAILLTHDHDDHAPGAGALSDATGAPVYAFRPRDDGWTQSARTLHDGASFTVGSGTISAVHTPGHSPDHFVFFVPGTDALFTGDAVLGRGTSVIDPPEGDLGAYMKSLERMAGLNARIIYPGHGPAIFNAAAKLDEYLTHRRMREAQILEALGEGPSSIGSLVERIYDGYPLEVRPLAARSVLAHLLKLTEEGRVAQTRGGGTEVFEMTAPRVCQRCGRPVQGRVRLCPRCTLEVLQEGPVR